MSVLEVLINSINAQIEELNKADLKIYDRDNVDWHITKIEYDGMDNRLYFDTKEDK
ncbi:hypothetical protein [Clostridium sp. 1001275B_160808_H3]|jgi:hypothetical protein|uniref:hypothetical protein n=1 Tax=Clostridium sp. 1001275B_160808_H3 TaxID=2787110 RepID=UPI001896A7C9|nr:hypothetical protein [Clostridium sp. 1001275B_160808_H3]